MTIKWIKVFVHVCMIISMFSILLCIKVLEILSQTSSTDESADFSPFPSRTTTLLFMLLHTVQITSNLTLAPAQLARVERVLARC